MDPRDRPPGLRGVGRPRSPDGRRHPLRPTEDGSDQAGRTSSTLCALRPNQVASAESATALSRVQTERRADQGMGRRGHHDQEEDRLEGRQLQVLQ